MAETLSEAIGHHRAGRFDQAELIYRRMLDDQPNLADAWHLLGVLTHQRGRSATAVRMIEKAAAIKPNTAPFHYNLGEAYRATGEIQKAFQHCQIALKLKPDSPEANNNMGLVLQSMGRSEEAIKHLQRAVELNPKLFLAYNNLGNLLREANRIDEAVAAIRKSLEIKPDLADAHCNLGQLLLEEGDTDQALFHCRRAAELKTDFPEAQNNLGNVLRERGELAEAKECYARAIKLRPNLAMSYNNMGQAFQEEGEFDEAVNWYNRALAIEPRCARFICNLASVWQTRENYRKAFELYRMAVQADAKYPEAHNGLGNVLREQGEFQTAQRCFEEALRVKPDCASAWVNLGQVREELGDLQEAEENFRTALEHEPGHTGALGCLATILRGKLPDEDVAAMKTRLADEQLNDGKRSALHHGLAHVLDAKGDYDEAAYHIERGNTLRAASTAKIHKPYVPAEHDCFVDQLIAGFSKEYFEHIDRWGLETETPVFVLGMPRSGTTLLEQILASHSRIHCAGELRYPKDSFDSLPKVLNSSRSPMECLPVLTKDKLQLMAQKHLDRLRRLNGDADRIVDKMPDNYLYLGFIASMFPGARIIHSRRDVRDVAVSCWITNFRSIRWAFTLEHIANRIENYERLMEHWRETSPLPMLEIDYEDTVADLEGVARRLIEFCGMEWEPACLEFYKTERPVRTASVTQVRQPIYSRSVERWRKYENALMPLLERLPVKAEV